MNSAAWSRRKEAYFLLVGRACEDCGATEGLHVHHLTYENLGAEPDKDLRVLCGAGEPRKTAKGLAGCHADRHDSMALWVGLTYKIMGKKHGFEIVRLEDGWVFSTIPLLSVAIDFCEGMDSVRRVAVPAVVKPG